jgi:hypothetical protein
MLGRKEAFKQSFGASMGQTIESAPDPVNGGLNIRGFQVNYTAGAKPFSNLPEKACGVTDMLDKVDRSNHREID